MKKLILTAAIVGFAIISCKKTENESISDIAQTEKSNEISNVQDVKTLKNSKGDVLKVTYFAEGDAVAVKIQKNNEPEHKLTAKTVSAKGNPIFTDDSYMWEMNDSATGGKLSDKDGNATEYLEESLK